MYSLFANYFEVLGWWVLIKYKEILLALSDCYLHLIFALHYYILGQDRWSSEGIHPTGGKVVFLGIPAWVRVALQVEDVLRPWSCKLFCSHAVLLSSMRLCTCMKLSMYISICKNEASLNKEFSKFPGPLICFLHCLIWPQKVLLTESLFSFCTSVCQPCPLPISYFLNLEGDFQSHNGELDTHFPPWPLKISPLGISDPIQSCKLWAFELCTMICSKLSF